MIATGRQGDDAVTAGSIGAKHASSFADGAVAGKINPEGSGQACSGADAAILSMEAPGVNESAFQMRSA
ncbi:hypothetical protein [Bosea thiooxidans]